MQETKEISPYKKGLRGKILAMAMKDFAERGIRAVKMDDVAAELAISKRTLYEIYENKELLLFEGVKAYHEQVSRQMNRIGQESENVMEIILRAYRLKVEEFRSTNPLFYSDLEKYPRILAFLRERREAYKDKNQQFFQRGIEEGYFRHDVNYELINLLFDAIGHYMMSRRLYKQFTIEDLFKNFAFISLRGLCTEKGIAALDEML